jgi:hypothetical protein
VLRGLCRLRVRLLLLDLDERLLDLLGLSFDVLDDLLARLGCLHLHDELVEQEQADVVLRSLGPDLERVLMTFSSRSSARKKNERKPTVTRDSTCPSKLVNRRSTTISETNATIIA